MNGTAIVLPNEQVLVARAVAEPEAFAAIYDHYFPRVYNYVRYQVQDADAADDVSSQVFERVLAHLSGYRTQRGPFAGWLFAIARYAVRDHLRAQRRHHWLSLDALRNLASPEPPPEQAVIETELREVVLAATARLNDRQRELIALKFGARLTNRQIAEVTGLSEANVGVLLYRAMRQLRAAMGEEERHERG